jgi:tetratricopeptide (TPR) repeat protein
MAQTTDFFVSYTSADRAWAEWIAWQLEADGYQVIVQAWDFTAGRDWAHEMQQATTKAERIVAVLSAAYLRSGHGEAEWRAFYAKDPSGERGLLLPVRVSDVEPPGLLTTRIYVDLVGRDATSAREALLGAVRGARGKPTQAPEFPGSRQSQLSATEAPRFPGELPRVWNVPFHPNPFFTGRNQLLAELQTRLQAPGRTARRVVLTGLGGVGKTSIAVEHVYRHQADYDLVWCVNGEQAASLLADLAALAGQLGLAPDAPQHEQVAALRSWLEHHERWLVVLDNVDDPQQVAEWLPRSTSGHVVLTSRAGVGWQPLASVLPVEVLSPADAAGLLLARAEETGPTAETAATTLAATLGGLPLAVEQAGAYVASTGTVTLAGYAELFDTRALELLRRGQPLSYQHTVATTWSLALEGLRTTEPAAVDLLTLASFVAPDDLPLPLLATHAGEYPEPLARVAADPLALADTVAALRRYSLIRVVADGLYVHRLLQTVARAGLAAEAQRAWVAVVVRLLSAAFPVDSDQVVNWPDCERLLPHALVVADHGRRLDVEPERCLSLLRQTATYLSSRGQYRQALTLSEQALAGSRQLLGEDHPATLQAIYDLAETRRALGDLQAALKLHEQILAAHHQVLGEDHPATLASINSLGVTRRELGDLQGAKHLFEEALAARRRVLGQDHADTLWSMNSLAVTRHGLGDLQGAQQLHEETLASRRLVLGKDHPNTLWSMNNLAETRRALGDLQGAQQLHEETLTARRRVLGDHHPHTLVSMSHLAEIRRNLGDLQGARRLFEQALAARRRVLGDDHPDTLWTMRDFAEARRNLGDLQGAHRLFEQALAARRRVLGDDHPDTLWTMSNLAGLRRDLGDLKGARDLHEQALAGLRRMLGDDHPNTLTTMNSLGVTLRTLGDLDGARQLHEQTLAARRRVLSNDHPNTLWSMNDLAETLRALGDMQRARQLHEQTLAARRQVLGNDHPNTLWSMNGLAETLRALGDMQRARQLHEQTLAARRQVLGNDHPATLRSMNGLATTLADLGDLEGARTLHEQALTGYRRMLGEDHPDTLLSMSNFAETRRGLGDLDGARQLFEQVLATRRWVLGPEHPETLASMNNLAAVRRELEQQ